MSPHKGKKNIRELGELGLATREVYLEKKEAKTNMQSWKGNLLEEEVEH